MLRTMCLSNLEIINLIKKFREMDESYSSNLAVLKLDSLIKAKLNVRAETMQFILNLDSWQKLIKK